MMKGMASALVHLDFKKLHFILCLKDIVHPEMKILSFSESI